MSKTEIAAIVIGLLMLVGGIKWIGSTVDRVVERQTTACESRGGVLIISRSGDWCIKSEAVITLD